MKKIVAGLMGLVFGAAGGAVISTNISEKALREQIKKTDKFKTYYNVLNQWMFLKQEGKHIASYFKENDYLSIAIYGMGELGNRLLKELEDSGIKIKYCMDSDLPWMDEQMNVVDDTINDKEIDVVVVTAMFAFNEIQERLEEEVSCPVISLEDVVYGI